MTHKNHLFQKIRNLASKHLRYSERIFTLKSVEWVLDMTATGMGIGDISMILECAPEDVSKDIFEITGYKGLSQTLDSNPLLYYNSSQQGYGELAGFLASISELTAEEMAHFINFLEVYNKIKKEIDDFDRPS